MKKRVKEKLKYDSGLVGYVIGILSIVMSLFEPVAGIIFGVIGLVQIKGNKDRLSKRARILNIIGLILGVVFAFLMVFLAYKFQGQFPVA